MNKHIVEVLELLDKDGSILHYLPNKERFEGDLFDGLDQRL
jgi:hypothetical protein